MNKILNQNNLCQNSSLEKKIIFNKWYNIFYLKRVFFMVNVVNKALKLRIFPDDDMIQVLEQNIGNARFIWVRQDRASNLLYAFAAYVSAVY